VKKFISRIFKRLNRLYRVSFIENETLSQSRQYMVRPLTVVLMCLLFLAIMIGGTTATIFYIPFVRQWVPNYQELSSGQAEVERLESQIVDLSRENQKLDSLLSGFQELLGGEGGGVAAQADEGEAQQEVRRPAAQPFASPEVVTSARQGTSEENLRIVYVSNAGGRGGSFRPQRLTFFVPVRGEIRRSFTPQNKHYGVDIVAAKDELVHAATDGFVILAEYSDKDGHVIGIAHPDNIVTFYKHNSRLLKKVGSPVVAGDPIAVIGNSGQNSTGPHLHFEVWDRGQPVDPMDYYASFQ
jgi:murein DD-endopeptidase MepM/ murein hydrolase activator NlpD